MGRLDGLARGWIDENGGCFFFFKDHRSKVTSGWEYGHELDAITLTQCLRKGKAIVCSWEYRCF